MMKFSEIENCWTAPVDLNAANPIKISVMAVDHTGRPGIHSIFYSSSVRDFDYNLKPGSDDYRIGAWPGNHVLGTQLGPNRNAKPLHHHK